MEEKRLTPRHDKATAHCKAFEDNVGAIELSRLPKMYPKTKHVNVSYHHFHNNVANGSKAVHHIPMTDQVADLLTKPLPQNQFLKLRKALMTY